MTKKIFIQFILSFICGLCGCGFLLGSFSCAPSKESRADDRVYTQLNSENNLALSSTQNIIGGQDLSLNSQINFSVVAIINTSDLGSFSICTGTFITKNIILTAAHCVSKNSSEIWIKFGNSIFSDKKSISLSVKNIIQHPNYESQKNDLALVQIINDKNILIQPVALASDLDILKPNNFILFGYGVNTSDESVADQMQGVGDLRKLQILSKFISSESDKFIVDQSNGYGVCSGDSGGPAFVLNAKNKYVLMGVASGVRQSESQTECSNQSEFTKVSAYQDWISTSIKKLDF